MKTIAIMNQKGGIGKTMTAASIAYLLGEEQGKKVLLVDADQQGNVSMLYDRYKPEGIGMECDSDDIHNGDKCNKVCGTDGMEFHEG